MKTNRIISLFFATSTLFVVLSCHLPVLAKGLLSIHHVDNALRNSSFGLECTSSFRTPFITDSISVYMPGNSQIHERGYFAPVIPNDDFSNTRGNKQLVSSIRLTGFVKGGLFMFDLVSNADLEGAGSLLITPLVFVPPFGFGLLAGMMARNIFDEKEVRLPDARMYTYGNFMGIWHGNILFNSRYKRTDGQPVRGHASFLAFSMMAEGWLTYGWSRWMNYNDYQVRGWVAGNIWGTFLGREVAYAVIGNSENYNKSLPYYQFGSAAAGMLLGAYFNKLYPRSKSQSLIVQSAGIIGYLLHRGFLDRHTTLHSRGIAGVAITGGFLAAAHHVTGKFNVDESTGMYLFTGVVLGGGLTGLMYNSFAIERNQRLNSRNFLVAGGAIVGAVGFLAIRNFAKAMKYYSFNQSRFRDVDIGLNPLGLAINSFSDKQQASLLQMNLYPELLSLKIPVR